MFDELSLANFVRVNKLRLLGWWKTAELRYRKRAVARRKTATAASALSRAAKRFSCDVLPSKTA
jgi:hypothetical protein